MSALEPPDRVVQRVLNRVAMGRRGCHISTYSVASHGYAQVGWCEGGERIVTLCHRVIWCHFRAVIPPGMTVDHMCKNRRCIRLMHLRLIPNLENARRTSGRDWALGECANGHADFLYWRPSGPDRKKGYCSACAAKTKAESAARCRNRPARRLDTSVPGSWTAHTSRALSSPAAPQRQSSRGPRSRCFSRSRRRAQADVWAAASRAAWSTRRGTRGACRAGSRPQRRPCRGQRSTGRRSRGSCAAYWGLVPRA